MVCSQRLLISTLFLLAPAAIAGHVSFAVSPKVCVKPSAENTCHIPLDIHVHLSTPQSVCIHTSLTPNGRRCKTIEDDWHLLMDVDSSASFDVFLSREEDGRILAQHPIKVAAFDPKAQRLKRRFGWGF